MCSRECQDGRRASLIRGVMVILILGGAPDALAKRGFRDLYQKVEASGAIAICRIAAIEGKDSRVEVISVLKGSIPQQILTLPIIQDGGSDASPPHTLPVGANTVVFLKPEGKRVYDVMGSLAIESPRDLEPTVKGIRRLVAITGMQPEHARARAMIREAASANPLLREAARVYMLLRLRNKEKRDPYRDELIALLKSADDDARSLALQTISSSNDPEFLPLIIAAARSGNAGVAESASNALYDHRDPESTAALIALARHPNERVRSSACGALQHRGDEANAVIASLLDDPSPRVRERAAGSVGGSASIPKLISMLDDPNTEVQFSAARGLARDPRGAAPLLRMLHRKGLNEKVEGAVVSSLGLYFPSGGSARVDPETARLVAAQTPLFINILGSNRSASTYALSVIVHAGTPEAIAAIERTAKSHPNQNIRQEAKWWLANRDRW